MLRPGMVSHLDEHIVEGLVEPCESISPLGDGADKFPEVCIVVELEGEGTLLLSVPFRR